MDRQLEEYLDQVRDRLVAKHQKLATAESCTGGLVSQQVTAIPGSSDWFEGGVVAYSNAVKHQLLKVPIDALEHYGAVSETVAKLMAQGVIAALQADVAISITGIAGPGGGSDEKPVGTVWIGWASRVQESAQCFHFAGDRQAVRHQALLSALAGLVRFLDNKD